MAPDLCFRIEDDLRIPMLVWRFPRDHRVISSGPLGGGLGDRRWVINATVPMWYDRDDPDTHLADMARGASLSGPGAGLMTGVDVAEAVSVTESDVTVWATVGLGAPILAAAPAQPDMPRVGTVNLIISVPVSLADAALVNAVATVAEAKAQAMRDLGLDATGTPTDATCVFAPHGAGEERYGGPRSAYGSIIARLTHEAMIIGGRRWLSQGIAWSDRIGVSPRDAISR